MFRLSFLRKATLQSADSSPKIEVVIFIIRQEIAELAFSTNILFGNSTSLQNSESYKPLMHTSHKYQLCDIFINIVSHYHRSRVTMYYPIILQAKIWCEFQWRTYFSLAARGESLSLPFPASTSSGLWHKSKFKSCSHCISFSTQTSLCYGLILLYTVNMFYSPWSNKELTGQ